MLDERLVASLLRDIIGEGKMRACYENGNAEGI